MTQDSVLHLGDVYGVSRDLPLNYVERARVDGAFIESLTRDKHIVIFGSSKQGKTSLRRWNLEDSDYVTITCSNKWSLRDIHGAILKAAGYTTEVSTSRTSTGETKIRASFSAKLKTPLIDAGAEVGGDNSTGAQTTNVTTPLVLDPSDVNDIILALRDIDFDQYIVLEDFHYLPEEAQQDFAFALKAFHESSHLSFIIVGVWLDENRLIQLNGDLAGRVLAIDADSWTSAELESVINEGAALLNINFQSHFRAQLIESCFESVWIVQECCYRVCEQSGIHHSDHPIIDVGVDVDAGAIAQDVVNTQSARYNSFLAGFAEGFMETSLEMYRWILLPLIVIEPTDLEQGVPYAEVRRLINRFHPAAPVNPGNITQALKSTASLQVKLNLKPLVVDYNQSRRRLDVVDRSFLIWLQHQSTDELLSICGLPDAILAEDS